MKVSKGVGGKKEGVRELSKVMSLPVRVKDWGRGYHPVKFETACLFQLCNQDFPFPVIRLGCC